LNKGSPELQTQDSSVPIVEKAAKEFGFNYNLKPSFVQAFHSHVRRLKELGKQI